jgi:hypothetical protein
MFSCINSGDNLKYAYPSNLESIPRSSLGYKTNNQYPNIPPRMSDGRAITASYQPEAVINNQLLQETGIRTNWEYRNYLTQNAKAIINYNFTESANDCGYYQRFVEPPKVVNTPSPYLYSSYMDNTPVAGVADSDLKQLYLSREQLNARRIAPAITQEDFLKMKQGKQ